MVRGNGHQGVWTLHASTAVVVVALLVAGVIVELTRTASSMQSQPAATPRSAEGPTFPHPPDRSGAGRRIVFDQSDQRVWLVGDDGAVVRSYLVSGSSHDNVRPGSYAVTSRVRHAKSYRGNGTFEYFVGFAKGKYAPIGFHSVTVNGQGRYVYARADLGAPRTPGCVEQWPDDAKALWEFAPAGTRVEVVP